MPATMPAPDLTGIVDLERYPIGDLDGFVAQCHDTLERTGALVLPGFVVEAANRNLREEAHSGRPLAYFCAQDHSAYLSPPDPAYPPDHARNRQVVSTKGCITDDQVPADSILRTLYDSDAFRAFLCRTLGESALYRYEDPLSSINVHYYEPGQQLGWHFDNSSFAITLTIQTPQAGGELEYVKQLRDAEQGNMNYPGVARVLDGESDRERLVFSDGMLVLFRGRNTLHRVTPVRESRERIQVVLAYNTEPGVSLSESARMTFYGRLG